MHNKNERAARAQIFQPFDALKGLKECIRQKERVIVPKKKLSSDALEVLDQQFQQVKVGVMIRVVYYDVDDYVQVTGMVTKVNLDALVIKIVDQMISIHHIVDISFPDNE